MKLRHSRSKFNHPWRWLIVVVVIAVLSGNLLWQRKHDTHNPSPVYTIPEPTTQPATTNRQLTGRYLFNGTIFWGRAIEKWSQRADGSYDYAHPFSGLDTFKPKRYDAWVADLECPSLDIRIPYQTQVNNLVFNCRPEYLKEAAKYFDIIDLANNHSGDQGLDGFTETRRRVIDHGMQVYGHYDPGVSEDRCEVIALPVMITAERAGRKVSHLPVAFCAWHYFSRLPRKGEIEAMSAYAKQMPVFAFVHMGTEYLTEANAYQVDVAHRVIDAGADFVIANNPHWVQNSEVYKGKLIFYSTGNFIFDQVDAEGMRSASVDLQLSAKVDANLDKWLELGTQCQKLHDDCFNQAQAQGLAKPQYELQFAVVAGDNSNHLTKRGDAQLQKAIETRTRWLQTLRQLKQP